MAPPPEPALFTAADEEVMATFIAWLAVDGHDHLIVEPRDQQRGRFSGAARAGWATPPSACHGGVPHHIAGLCEIVN